MKIYIDINPNTVYETYCNMPDDGNVSIESVVDTCSRMFLSVSLLTIAFVLQRHIMIQGANIFAAIAAFIGKIVGAIITV